MIRNFFFPLISSSVNFVLKWPDLGDIKEMYVALMCLFGGRFFGIRRWKKYKNKVVFCFFLERTYKTSMTFNAWWVGFIGHLKWDPIFRIGWNFVRNQLFSGIWIFRIWHRYKCKRKCKMNNLVKFCILLTWAN